METLLVGRNTQNKDEIELKVLSADPHKRKNFRIPENGEIHQVENLSSKMSLF